MPLSAVGSAMTWGEAWRQTQLLLRDPSSWVGAVHAGWEHPVNRATLVLMDLYDLVHYAAWSFGGGKGAKPKPYPRPVEIRQGVTKPKPSMPQSDVLAALRYAGHTLPIPA